MDNEDALNEVKRILCRSIIVNGHVTIFDALKACRIMEEGIVTDCLNQAARVLRDKLDKQGCLSQEDIYEAFDCETI